MIRNFLAWLRAFVRPPRHERVNLGRRALLLSTTIGVSTAALSRVGTTEGHQSFTPSLIRPPGAMPEEEFLGRCVRCGECMRVCPTNALQPASGEGGWTAVWTPVLKMKTGYCEYECSLCSQVCPTQAIQIVTLEQKKKIHIGTAFFDRNRCLPYASARTCIVCEEHCPTPKKAIWFEEISVLRLNGERVTVKQPRVDLELCIGCGICENKCPIADQRGVYVTSVGESRHPKNQILLSAGSDSAVGY